MPKNPLDAGPFADVWATVPGTIDALRREYPAKAHEMAAALITWDDELGDRFAIREALEARYGRNNVHPSGRMTGSSWALEVRLPDVEGEGRRVVRIQSNNGTVPGSEAPE